MGASDSKHMDEAQQLNAAGHHSEEDTRTPPVNKRLVKLTDPRSPTDAVDRTPIVAEKVKNADGDDTQTTPLRIDTSVSSAEVDAHDPRSPSCNVARTPQPFTFVDPRSPSGNVARTPFIKHVNDATDPRSPNPDIERTPFVSKDDQKAKPTKSSSFECLVDDDQPSSSVQENLNSSNSNIEPEEDTTQNEAAETESQKLIQKESNSGLTQIDTPQYEAELTKLVEKQSLVTVYCEPEEEHSQEEGEQGLISATDASKKTKKNKKSLKIKMHEKLHGGAPRSPLSTRNLLSDSPASLQLNSGSNTVTYADKANAKRRHTVATPTRLVGRYEPIVDKENA